MIEPRSLAFGICIGGTLMVSVLGYAQTEAEPSSASAARVWTDSTGQHVRRGHFEARRGDTVILRSLDGKTIKVPLARLSKTDREWVRRRASDRGPRAAFEEPANDGPLGHSLDWCMRSMGKPSDGFPTDDGTKFHATWGGDGNEISCIFNCTVQPPRCEGVEYGGAKADDRDRIRYLLRINTPNDGEWSHPRRSTKCLKTEAEYVALTEKERLVFLIGVVEWDGPHGQHASIMGSGGLSIADSVSGPASRDFFRRWEFYSPEESSNSR